MKNIEKVMTVSSVGICNLEHCFLNWVTGTNTESKLMATKRGGGGKVDEGELEVLTSSY